MLISIEGGYEQIGEYYFIVTYACIYDIYDNCFIGKSQGLQITKRMFECVKVGKSLNKTIEEILDTNNNKKDNGITGFLTEGYYQRAKFDSSAVISAMQIMNNMEKYKSLDKNLKK